jgi:predicted enzyme related to lactoylglutathione lyase
MSTKNTLVWVDLSVTNLKRAIKFYSAILGEKVKLEKMPGFAYGLLPHTKNNASGCLVKMRGYKPSKTGPLVYFNVDGRHDQAEKAVVKNGGKILMKKHPIGPYGNRSVVLDSEGNRIALHSSE